MTKRINERGEEEYAYLFINIFNGKYEERHFWSPLRYPSKSTGPYVRAEEAETIEIHRARARGWLRKYEHESALAAPTPAARTVEPAQQMMVPLPIKKSSTIFQRYAPRT